VQDRAVAEPAVRIDHATASFLPDGFGHMDRHTSQHDRPLSLGVNCHGRLLVADQIARGVIPVAATNGHDETARAGTFDKRDAVVGRQGIQAHGPNFETLGRHIGHSRRSLIGAGEIEPACLAG